MQICYIMKAMYETVVLVNVYPLCHIAFPLSYPSLLSQIPLITERGETFKLVLKSL